MSYQTSWSTFNMCVEKGEKSKSEYKLNKKIKTQENRQFNKISNYQVGLISFSARPIYIAVGMTS